MQSIRIALAQVNVTVGALRSNTEKIIAQIDAARKQGAKLVAFPELALCGYPPEDLLLKPVFVRACREALQQVARASKALVVIVGFPEKGDKLYNAAAILCDGRLVATYRKQCLPNYGVFDEKRYFEPSEQNEVFQSKGLRFGISICEDIWIPSGPHQEQALRGGAKLLLNISASPYHRKKGRMRERMFQDRAKANRVVLACCNLVGGQDELVFDGQSVVIDQTGKILARAKSFQEDLLIVDLPNQGENQGERKISSDLKVVSVPCSLESNLESKQRRPLKLLKPRVEKPLAEMQEIYSALVLGTKDYIQKNSFSKVVIGLSGGIDSSLVACIAVDALSPENVFGVSMPSRYSSSHSYDDAELLAKKLKIKMMTIPIEPAHHAYLEMLKPYFSKTHPNVAEENLQSRIRGTILMALSNKFGWLVLTTGNKSEMSVGYATLYGDMAGGFAVIKDVPKTLVYALSRYRNQVDRVIPKNVLVKAPSAELRPNQKDVDSLPAYEVLDPILAAYIERDSGLSEIVQEGFDIHTVKKVIKLVDSAEYKRRQAPPGVKITPRALGKDWRLPLTNQFAESK